MGDNTVIRLDDVRRLKAAGLRLNPPVSAGYNAAWTALTDAQAAFLLAVEAYSDSGGSATKWWSVRRRLAGVDRAMTGCLKFLAELEGDWIGDGKLTFESEQAAREYRLLKRFILVRAAPFLNFWNEAIYALDSGDALTIKPEELQRWNDT